MTNKKTLGAVVTYTLISTVALSLIISLTFFIFCNKAFDIKFNYLFKPITLFTSLSFLQSLAAGLGFRRKYKFLFEASIITILASYITLILSLLSCNGEIWLGVVFYAALSILSSALLIILHFILDIPSICRGLKSFFTTLPEKRYVAKNKKIIDARNMHNAAEDEIIKKG